MSRARTAYDRAYREEHREELAAAGRARYQQQKKRKQYIAFLENPMNLWCRPGGPGPPSRSGQGYAVEMACRIFAEAKRVGHLPKCGTSDNDWIVRMRRAKAGKGRAVWYPILGGIAAEYGFPRMFDSVKPKGKVHAVATARRIFAEAKRVGHLPEFGTSDYAWIGNLRRAKAGKEGNTWYHVVEKIAAQYGFPNVFDYVKPVGKKHAVDTARRIFAEAKRIGHLPRCGTSDYKWIATMRQAKAGKGGNTWYHALDEIAKQYGFPRLFYGHGSPTVKRRAARAE